MSAGLTAAVLPTVISSSGFAARRLDRARQANDAAQTVMNSVVASGQIERAAECSANIVKAASPELANMFMSAEESIKAASGAEKAASVSSESFLKTAGGKLLKALKFVGDYVNEFIIFTSGLRVLTSDEPIKEGFVEGAGIVGMLAITEPAYKRLAGMSTYERKNGKLITHEHEALIRKLPYASSSIDAMKDYFAVKKFFGMTLKHVPKIAKGFGLILSSIAGYLGGRKLALCVYEKITGESGENAVPSLAANKELVPVRETA
jgi:hypothetical protein